MPLSRPFRSLAPALALVTVATLAATLAGAGSASAAPATSAPLQITEVIPDTANVKSADGTSADGYEYIEVYNSTDAAIDFGDYTLKYLYPLSATTTSQTTLWPAEPANVVITPGGTLTVWVKNAANEALTDVDFNKKFGTKLTMGKDLVIIHSAGMANSGARGMEIDTNTGVPINSVLYNFPAGTVDVKVDQGIHYKNDPANPTRQLLVKTAAATPGVVDPAQVPTGLTPVVADTSDPVVIDRSPTTADPAADIPLALTVTDDVQVRTVKLHLKSNTDPDFTVSQLLVDRAGTFGYAVPAVDLVGKRSFEYFFTVSDGSNTVTTAPKTITVNGYDDAPVRLNVTDGQYVAGTTTLSAAANDAAAAPSITVDGATLPTVSSLESTPFFAFDAGGVNVFFKNGVRAGAKDDGDILRIFDDGIPEGYATISVPVPLRYVTKGDDVVLRVYAGTKAAPSIDLGENNDDFTIKHLRLVLPDGNTIAPTDYTDPTKVLNMGDGTDAAGKPTGKLDFYEAHFVIPDSSYLASSDQWDSTKAADGEHTVIATTGTDTASSVIRVDNTAPVLTTKLEEGKEYRGRFTIDGVATDAGSGLDALTAQLDGSTVTLPYDTSSITLNSGTHTVLLHAKDKLGNTSEITRTFTTPKEQPNTELVSPADRAIVDGGDVELVAKPADEKKDALDVSFKTGFSLTPSSPSVSSFSGVTGDARDAARTERKLLTGAELTQMTGADGVSTTTSSDSGLPYEMFDVTVPEGSGSDFTARLSWAGSANADAKVLMYVFNQTTGAWEEVDRKVTTGGAPTSFTLGALVPAAEHVRDGKISVLIQHSEGFAGADRSDRSTTVTDYNVGATPRKDYDFTLGWETDTQYYNASYPELQTGIHDFFLKQRDNLNLQYVFHTGDVVDDSSVQNQWDNATKAYTMLDDAKLPYGIVAGNHDVGHKEDDYTQFTKYFGENRYAANPWYGGSYQNNRGHYDLFSSGGIDFMVVYIGWDPGNAELAWMDEVIKKYPERKVILDMHEYILTTGGLGPLPQRIMDEVVAPNPNVMMVFCGHYHDAFTRIDQFDDNGDGINDRNVYALLFDYQGLPEGGEGYVRLLHFDNQGKKMTVRTYTPHLDVFDSDDPTLDMSAQEFSVNYADVGIVPATKTIATDSFEADILTTTPIKTFGGVASGSTVKTTWSGLAAGEHGWYVASTNPVGAVDLSAVRTFTVVPKAPAPSTDPTPDDRLTDAARGGIDSPAEGHPGQQIVVGIPGHVGDTVRVWLHSAPVLLAVTEVGQSGYVAVTLPADAELGAHKIVVQAADGSLIGWDDIRLTAAPPVTVPAGGVGDPLASTGTDPVGWLVAGMLLLALGGLTGFGARLRKRGTTAS